MGGWVGYLEDGDGIEDGFAVIIELLGAARDDRGALDLAAFRCGDLERERVGGWVGG